MLGAEMHSLQGDSWQRPALGGLRAEPPQCGPERRGEVAPSFHSRHEQGGPSKEAALGSMALFGFPSKRQNTAKFYLKSIG